MSLYLEWLSNPNPPEQACYAWVIDHTWTPDPADDSKLVEETDGSDNGTTGPSNAPAELLERLGQGRGRVWRTLYDVDYPDHPEDLRVAHTGRYLDWSDLSLDPEGDDGDLALREVDAGAEHGPLDDFSGPANGAVVIQYQEDDETWKTL